jgi:RNA polymerase sigma-70 factor (TIGR02943 family)
MDIAEAIGEMRPLLIKLARLQLRNEAWAEDVVSTTMIAALERTTTFQARSTLRTWVIGILKHKIVDQLRLHKREISIEAQIESGANDSMDDLYNADGSPARPPLEWGDPEALMSQREFINVIQVCVDELPGSLGRAFLMREWLGYETPEICKELGITVTNCYVMLFRARTRLREYLEAKWFRERLAA